MIKKSEKYEKLIKYPEQLSRHLENHNSLENCTLQDLKPKGINWEKIKIANTTFLGCELPLEEEILLRELGANFFPRKQGLPYNPYRRELYTWQELMDGWSPEFDGSKDLDIYDHFSASKYSPSISEALSQRIHDHAIDDSLRYLIQINEEGMPHKKCVGFMGGHGTLRSDQFYLKTAFSAKLLAENGYFIVSGGGPGIMEATNLGAYLAGKSNSDLKKALEILAKAPHYSDKQYMSASFEVLKLFPEGGASLAIPTWFYGHEPSNLFASHIAKYFSNSIREETLLAICLHGIIFAPGSAGTTQEIFQDATQNHYGTLNYYSPMVFLGRQRYEIETLIYPLLKQLAWGRKYFDMIHITDDPDDILRFLEANPPIKT